MPGDGPARSFGLPKPVSATLFQVPASHHALGPVEHTPLAVSILQSARRIRGAPAVRAAAVGNAGAALAWDVVGSSASAAGSDSNSCSLDDADEDHWLTID